MRNICPMRHLGDMAAERDISAGCLWGTCCMFVGECGVKSLVCRQHFRRNSWGGSWGKQRRGTNSIFFRGEIYSYSYFYCKVQKSQLKSKFKIWIQQTWGSQICVLWLQWTTLLFCPGQSQLDFIFSPKEEQTVARQPRYFALIGCRSIPLHPVIVYNAPWKSIMSPEVTDSFANAYWPCKSRLAEYNIIKTITCCTNYVDTLMTNNKRKEMKHRLSPMETT